MPDQATIQRARRDAREGKSASTQAGEFVRDEIRKVRQGKHGVRNTKQAIAIGLSEARRSGVKLPGPAKGKTSAATRQKANRDAAKGKAAKGARAAAPSRKRSAATLKALRKEPRAGASSRALSRQAHDAARRRSPTERSASARKAARTRRHTSR